ncbi:MAG: CynX/NimT family MFS transporter [Anaerovoracaceae bacterium]
MSISRRNSILAVVLIITTAVCLRAPITSVGAILYCIIEDLKLSGTVAGSITTIPLVVMALFSPFVSRISEKKGIGRSLFMGMVLMIGGILLRSFGGVSGLLAGTAIIAMGITFGNVLVPAIIKIFFPDKVGAMTGIYTTTMSTCSGIGAGLSVPVAVGLGLGWRLMFCTWAVTSLICMCVVMVYIRVNPEKYAEGRTANPSGLGKEQQSDNRIQSANPPRKQLYRIPMAWYLAVMFAGQSCVFYTLTAWLPTIITDRGFTAGAAGTVAMIFQVAAIPANFLVPVIAGRVKKVGALASGVAALGLVGVIFIFFAQSMPAFYIGAALVELGVGGVFSLNLALYGMKTDNGVDAARISGFAQSAGYLLAAAGPMAAGILYDLTSDWTLPLIFCIGVMVADIIASYLAGSGNKI